MERGLVTAAELAARRREIRASHEADRARKALAAADRKHARDPRVPGRDHPLRNGGVYRAPRRQAGAVDDLALDLLALIALCGVVLPLFSTGGWLGSGLVLANVLLVGGIVLAALAIGARLMPEDEIDRDPADRDRADRGRR
jgi:Flp pilus assembly protein TadB